MTSHEEYLHSQTRRTRLSKSYLEALRQRMFSENGCGSRSDFVGHMRDRACFLSNCASMTQSRIAEIDGRSGHYSPNEALRKRFEKISNSV